MREEVTDPFATPVLLEENSESDGAGSSSLALEISLRVLARLESLGGQPKGGNPRGPPSGPNALYNNFKRQNFEHKINKYNYNNHIDFELCIELHLQH